MKRIDYYKTYYENLSPSNFKVEKQDDKIVISGIENHYPKGFDDKDVKQYKMKQSKIHKYEKGGRTKGLIKKPITTNYQQIRNWIDEYFIDKEHLGEIHHSNKSSTDFGTSWYTIVDINGAFFVEPITIRISDHSTGNRRVLSEIQLSSYTNNKKEIFKILDLTFDKYFKKGGRTKKEEPFVPRVERSGKWDESYSILCDELATYEMGGVMKTEIDEYGSNVPKALQEVFDQFDEDADAYVEAERLRMKANEIGYDFDYGLSGEPTDFWKISDSYKKGGYVSWKDKYNKKYGYAKGKSHSLKEISKDTKVSMKGLQKIYDKGVGARKTNPQSVRSVSDGKKRGGKSLKGKMSAEQWAMARVYSSVMGGKASKVDAKELKMAKGGSTSKKSCYTKELKYKDGGMIFTFEEGGEISDTCYVNYEGYQIQSTRCKREGITYFMIGEYPEVAKALYKNYTSEWIYYNRLARLFISPETAKQFIQEASKYFNPIVPIEPYFLDVDRSFATYSVRDTRPFEDVPISVSVGKTTTARKLGDKIQERKREEQRLKRIETLKTQGKPFFKEDDYRKADGKYWAISTIISLGGEGDWGDDKWKNAITRENIPYDNGISLMTLIHEYAHCLDFNQSIAKGRVYERPLYELELLSGRNSIGQKFSSQEMKSMREAQQSGQKRTTLLSNHKEYFIQALSDILRGGMSNGIPILNEIENEAHEIEKRVGGKAYADEQRKKVQEDFLLKMQKTIEKANKPSLSVKFPTQLKEYLSRTSANYILQLSQKEINKKVGTELLPHISNFKDVVRENMAFNPTENAKLLKDLRKIEKDIKRLQERT